MKTALLRAKACRIELVLTDSDGVLTDNGVYYSAHGEEMKQFSIRDGMGVERLRSQGSATGIIASQSPDCSGRQRVFIERQLLRGHS